MHEFEKRILDTLNYSEAIGNDDVIFPDFGYVVEGAYKDGSLSNAWRDEYEKYCSEYPPGTDEFSYLELMIQIYGKFKSNA